MTGEPDYLFVDEVLCLHQEQLARYGGAQGVRDLRAVGVGGGFFPGLLRRQVRAPRPVCDGRGRYAVHLAQNQPFVDGNKRTALAAALVFLDLNKK